MTPVRFMLMEMALRGNVLSGEIAHSPAFPMLLDLFDAGDKRISVTSLCLASHAPATTALRHIDLLKSAQLVTRERDPHDRRRHFIVLTAEGRAAVAGYLDALQKLMQQVAA